MAFYQTSFKGFLAYSFSVCLAFFCFAAIRWWQLQSRQQPSHLPSPSSPVPSFYYLLCPLWHWFIKCCCGFRLRVFVWFGISVSKCGCRIELWNSLGLMYIFHYPLSLLLHMVALCILTNRLARCVIGTTCWSKQQLALALSTCHRNLVTTELYLIILNIYLYIMNNILIFYLLYSMFYILYSPFLLLQIMLTMRSRNRCSRQTTAMSTLYSMTPSYKPRRISSRKVFSILDLFSFSYSMQALFLPLVLILLISFSANLDSKSYSK